MTRFERIFASAVATMLIAGVLIVLSELFARPERYLAGVVVAVVFTYCMEHLKNDR